MIYGILILGTIVGFLAYRYVVAKRRAKRKGWIDIIDAEGEQHRIPLPPHSIPGEDINKNNEYFTTATVPELKVFIHQSLPDAGWTYSDISREKLGTSVVYYRDDKRLHILLESDVDMFRSPSIRNKLTISVATNVKPSQLEQEVSSIKKLGESGNKEAVESLIAHLFDKRSKIRKEAISALRIIKDEKSLQPLIEKLIDDSTEVRISAAVALGEFESRQAVDALIVGLNSIEGDFKTTCAWALGKIKDKKAVPALISALKNPYWKLKIHAAMALGEIGGRSSVEPLIACLEDEKNDSQVRMMAFLSLKKIISEDEINLILQQISTQSDQYSFEDQMKNIVAENIASFATGLIFDLLGIDH